jgi:putative ABC transport system permease protein
MNSILQDLRYGLRRLGRSPGFTLAAVLTLALGIGANTAIFGVIDTVLLRPLQYPHSERLVRVWGVNAEKGQTDANVNPLDFSDYGRQVRTLGAIGGMALRQYALTGEGEPERVRGAIASDSFFTAFGAVPARGRRFSVEEQAPGGTPVALLSDALWKRRYHSDPGVLGKKILVNDKPVTIIGVLPGGFRAPAVSDADQPQIWLPLQIKPTMGRGGHWLLTFARLADGVTPQQAQSELETVASRLQQQYPDTNRGWSIRLQDLKASIVGDTRAALLLLFASVGLVLLIACANVANLQLARAATRQQEVVVRSALGASLSRLFRQLITESVLLGAIGGGVGLGFAYLSISLLVWLRPENLPRVDEIGIDGRVLLFSLGLSIFTGLLFGLIPALRTATPDLSSILRQGGRSSAGRRIPAALVIVEFALALVLLIGAGLLIKSFSRLLAVDPGFRTHGLLTANVDLPGSRYGEPTQISAFYQRLLARAAALPGAQGATIVDILPFSGLYSCNSFSVAGSAAAEAEKVPCIEYRTVGLEYFNVMGLPLESGRSFLESDGATGPPVAIVNETLARSLWPGRSPLGQVITLGFEKETPHTIVGVVKDVHHFGLQKEAAPEVYVDYLQHPASTMTVVLRADQNPSRLAGPLRQEVWSIDPQLPLAQISTMDELVTGSVAQSRLRTVILLTFALIALGLAAVGVFGVVSHSVARRTQEIGVRMALGADRSRVLKLILGQTLSYAGLGLVLGILAAVSLTRFLTSFLFGIGTLDLSIFAASSVVLLLVVLLASYLPARQASRLEPLTALKPAE